ncbi:hypothetical protein ACOI1C_11895 [Bacillus sp. DJP31]|uniref:hypothetical protein n=1 Tax=Bacillus sp. DJP31 TaxID=3409789 RepID=UPI003BB4E284
MGNWKDINIQGIARIEKVVGEFIVWELDKTPYGKFKVKIIENLQGTFTGYPNIELKNKEDGSPEWVSGMGQTIDEALEDTLKCFLEMINEREELTEDNFEWSDRYDF